MKKLLLVVFLLLLLSSNALAGPYAPTAGHSDYAAVFKDDPDFAAWATGHVNLVYGSNVDNQWKTPHKAYGKAFGDSYDIVCLGRGGRITMTFDQPIRNRAKWDFAVFENSFNDTFLELGYVEVSSDGVNFTRFPNRSLTADPVPGFGDVDPSNLMGLASKYRQGYGMPFDLQELADNPEVKNGQVDISSITHVRIIDIVGDGTYFDSTGHVIYDPYPTVGSAGFDLDAIGLKYTGNYANSLPLQAVLLQPGDGQASVPLTREFQTGAFNDVDVNGDDADFHSWTRWQAASDAGFANIAADITTWTGLTKWTPAWGVLDYNKTYYWRVKHYDFAYTPGAANEALYPWSASRLVQTEAGPADNNSNNIPDNLELQDITVDLDENGVPDMNQTGADNTFMGMKSVTNQGPIAVKAPVNNSIEAFNSIDPAADPEILAGETQFEDFILGVMCFRVKTANPGDTVNITVYFPFAAPADYDYYKMDSSSNWTRFAGAVFAPDRRSVVLTLQDGGAGDVDGAANGVIVDPGGLATVVPGGGGATPPAPSGGEAGFGGGGGGCFINSLE